MTMSGSTRYSNMDLIGASMDGRWCGPVPPQTFLDTFLDVSKLAESHREKMPQLTQPCEEPLRLAATGSKNIQEDHGSDGCLTSKSLSCDALIKTLNTFCPKLKLVNTADSPQNVTWSDHNYSLNPDVTVYDPSNQPPDERTQIDLTRAEIFFDISGGEGVDPFELLDDKTGTSHSSEATMILDSIATYAGVILCSQFRTHCFGILIFDGYVRLIRWDRGGATFSEAFHLWKSSFLMDFLWRYNWADGATRGHDPSVVALNDKEEGDGRRRASRTREILGMGENETVYQFTIEDEKDGKKHVFLGGRVAMRTEDPAPAGRSTRGFYVVPPEAADLRGPLMRRSIYTHYLKDTWRYSDMSEVEPEGKIYHRLQEAQVPHIPTILASGDALGAWQTTVYLAKKKPSIREHRHYFIVMKEVGSPLLSFQLEKGLIGAMRDALEAHQKAYELAHVLHRDISIGNILIFGQGGLLIDWEYSRIFTPGIPTVLAPDSHTGTWSFVSARILRKGGGKHILHTVTDDLESFFHILCWISVQYIKNDIPTDKIKFFLGIWFNSSKALSVPSTQCSIRTPILSAGHQETSFFIWWNNITLSRRAMASWERDALLWQIEGLKGISESYAAARNELSHLQDHKWMLQLFNETLGNLNEIPDDLQRRVDRLNPQPPAKTSHTLDTATEDPKRKTSSEHSKNLSESESSPNQTELIAEEEAVVQNDKKSLEVEPDCTGEGLSMNKACQRSDPEEGSLLNPKKRKRNDTSSD
ncbi:hypothetical protein L218DRAFT_991041 [Marasmius fiardii PR-910]|nr:hypothetical protein L218DRAFT_991041 [Marasmius fiardii PR-910]